MRPSMLIHGVVLHLLAPLALATSVSLPDFEEIPPSVSRLCALAYDAPIPGCSRSDFTGGATCSSKCILGLESLANTINTVCFGVSVDPDTLLGNIFENHIVQSLCSRGGAATTEAPAQPSTTPTVASTSKSTPPSKPTASVAETSAAASTTASSSNDDSSSTTAVAASTSDSADTVASSPTTTVAAEQPLSSSTSSATANQTPNSQAGSNSRAGLTVQQQQIAAMANSGGGSPFDIVGYSAASCLSQQGTLIWTGATVIWAAVLMLR